MSGQPTIHPSDAAKFREQYLANLSLQVAIDDKNLQANKVFKRTGQTPSIVLDTRTTAEKLADKLRLGTEVRSGLKEIMDGVTAEQVVQQLSNDELEFVSQHLPDIIAQLKPKYKYGVPLVAFTAFITKYFKASMESADYLAGLQQVSGEKVLMGIRQILDNMVDRETLDEIKDDIKMSLFNKQTALTRSLERNLDDMRSVIPTKEKIIEMLSTGLVVATDEIERRMNDALQELPTKQLLTTHIVQLNQAIRARDEKRQAEVLEKLNELLTMPPEVKEQMAAITQELGAMRQEATQGREDLRKLVLTETAKLGNLTRAKAEMIIDRTTKQLSDYIAQGGDASMSEMKRFVRESIADQLEGVKEAFAEDADAKRQIQSRIEQLSSQISVDQKDAIRRLKQSKDALSQAKDKRAYVDRLLRTTGTGREIGEAILAGQNKKDFIKMVLGPNAREDTNLGAPALNQLIDVINQRIDVLTSAYTVGAAEAPASGSGVKRGRPKGSGIKGRGIQQDPNVQGIEKNPNRYATFGRFKINTHKLNDDIITLKRITGCNVDGIPVKRVSKELGNVMRTIVGGGHPEYRHLDKLSDEEKVYLAKIAKKADIEDRLNVPTPNRDDDEKDVHQFEVMKGEIMSGNDNAEMVKKFKLLIMKLSRKEMLPKNQAKDIMMDLATLGY
jgi:hypothetical protein